ncbi:MAG TPA: DMT family transporter [Devosia sp.]|nr:DMT family transporter [Devosia sp.]
MTGNAVSHRHRASALWPGVPFAIGAAILFGASAPLSKMLLGTINPWLLAGILYLGAGLGLALVRYGRKAIGLPDAEAPLRRADMSWLAAILFFGGFLGPLLLMFGLSMISGSAGSLLLNVEGIATMGIAWLIFRENVDRRLLLGALAIVAGAVALTWTGGGLQLDLGGLLVVGACLCWGLDNNLTRKLSSADPVEIAMVKGLVAGLANLILALATGATIPPLSFILAGSLVGFFGIGVSLVLFMLGLRHLGAARTGAYFSLAPFIGAVLALVLLGETVTIQLVIAGLLMGAGLWVHLAERHEHEHVHEPLEHEHSHVHDIHHQHPHDGPITEPHSHPHRHEVLVHSHPHYPDLHHRHRHG